jgi:hypothetical protein
MYHNTMNSTKRRFLICTYNKTEINFGFKIDSNHQCQFENFRRNVGEIKSSKTCYNFNCYFTVHFDKFKDFCQQMLSLLKHKMLQLTLKIFLYMGAVRRVTLGAVRRVTHTPHSTQYTHYRLKHILPQHSNIFNDVFLLIILQGL